MKGRHLLRKVDVCRFLRLVPDWDRYSERLERVLLDCSSDSGLGWYGYTGVIAVHAFPRDLTLTFDPSYFYMDLAFMKKVGVGFCENDAGEIVCKFTRSQARAYQLLRVLVHEFGHHVDYVTNRRRACTRGERFAEAFTDKIEAEIWPSYVQTFGDPQRQQ